MEPHQAATSLATEDTMEYDALSGRTLAKHDPWRQILRERQSKKQPPPLLRTPPAPKLPESDYKIVFRPRSGLRISAWPDRQLTHSIQQASLIPERRFYAQVITQPQAQQNLITVSTPDEDCAEALRHITTLQLGTTTYEVTAYLKPPPGTVRGILHGIDQGTTPDQLREAIITTGPTILDARMLGASTTAVITFEGPHVPFYVRAYGILTRCKPYRRTYQCCSLCGALGHRQDVCPNPQIEICGQCHAKNPAPQHNCKPTCQLCGLEHLTASKDCRRKLRPSPPPLRVRERELKQPDNSYHRYQPAPHYQPPPAPETHREQPQVRWSAVAALPPTAEIHYPPLPHRDTPPPPTLPNHDAQNEALKRENAQLKAQLEEKAKQFNTLEQQIAELRAQMQRQITPPPTTTTTENTDAVITIAPTNEDTNTTTLVQLVQPSSPPTNTTILTAFEDLKRYIHDAVTNLHTRFQQLDDRLTAIEADKRQRHKKPKHSPLPQILEDTAQSTRDDGDSSVLST